MGVVIVVLLAMAVIAVQWVWSARVARRQADALLVEARVGDTVRRRLGGEGLVTVTAVAPGGGRPGRVVVSMPRDWEPLLESAWGDVLGAVPGGYELVVPRRQPADGELRWS